MAKNRKSEDVRRPAVQPRIEYIPTGEDRPLLPEAQEPRPDELWQAKFRAVSGDDVRPRAKLAVVARAAFRALAAQEVGGRDWAIRSVPWALELVIRFCTEQAEREWRERRDITDEAKRYVAELRPDPDAESFHDPVRRAVTTLLGCIVEVAEEERLSTAGHAVAVFSLYYAARFPDGPTEEVRFARELDRDLSGLATVCEGTTGFDPMEGGPWGALWAPPAPPVRSLTEALKIGNWEDVPDLEATPTPPAVAGDVPLLDREQLPASPDGGRRSRVMRRIDFDELQGRLPLLVAELGRIHAPVVERFQRFLDQLAGEACAEPEDNLALAKRANELADAFGLELLLKTDDDDYRRVRLKFTSGVFEGRVPGRGGELLYSGALFPTLRARGPDSSVLGSTENLE